jgi:hypothetical protein
MLSSLQDINQYSGVTVIYLAGSSGEFFSYALAQTFPGIAQFQNKFSGETSTYSHADRVQFNDFFGRSLLTGDACISNHQLVIDRINWYLDYAVPTDAMHVGIAHPHPEYLDFLSKYCDSWKTITITVNTPTSERFCIQSRKSKLNSGWPDGNGHRIHRASTALNLNLEWQDMMLAPAHEIVLRIENFLGIPGDYKTYENLVIEYMHRNQHLIDVAAKSN